VGVRDARVGEWVFEGRGLASDAWVDADGVVRVLRGRRVVRWSFPKARRMGRYFGGAGFSSVSFSRDGRRVGAVDGSGRVHVFSPERGESWPAAPWLNRVAKTIVTSPLDGHFYASGMGAEDVWRVEVGPERLSMSRTERARNSDTKRLAFDARGCVYIGTFGSFLHWERDGASGRIPLSGEEDFQQEDFLTDLSATYSGRYVVALTGRRVLLFDEGGEMRELGAGKRGLYRASVRDTGEVLVAKRDRVLIFDSGGSRTRTWPVSGSTIQDAQWSPGGRRVALGHMDGSVSVWDSATGSQMARVKAHTERVAQVSVSPDGRWLASASWDATVGMLDLSAIDESQEEYRERARQWGLEANPRWR